MIIPASDNAKTPLKGGSPAAPNASGSQPTAGSPSGPPPSYGAHAQSQPYPARQIVVEQGFVYRESPGRRFWRAFFVAILIWFLLTLLAQSIAGLAYYDGRYNVQQWIGDFPVPSGVSLVDCVSGDTWFAPSFANRPSHATAQSSQFHRTSEASFDLPLSADNLFLLARGSRSHGTVNVETSKTGDSVKVHVIASYYDPEILKSGAEVCLVKRKNNEVGVGIFTRNWIGHRWGGSELHFDTTVVIPESTSGDKIRHIKGFETDFSNSPHRIGDLQELVEFQDINIKTSNARIYAQSIYAAKGSIISSNGAIEGTFNTSDSLFLRTTNSPIKVDVGLKNDDTHVTSLKISTTNSKLEANVDLVSSSENGGSYAVTASTTNSPLRVAFPTSPVDSTLKLSATTTNSPAAVSLHPSYEGSFELSTTQFLPKLVKHDASDPSGRERKRNVELGSTSRGSLRGRVSWSDNEGPGSVFVKSTNAFITLEL